MRMKMADDLCSALTASTVSIDQYLRIDFEMRLWPGVDIGGRQECGNSPLLPEQQAAALARVGGSGKVRHAVKNRA